MQTLSGAFTAAPNIWWYNSFIFFDGILSSSLLPHLTLGWKSESSRTGHLVSWLDLWLSKGSQHPMPEIILLWEDGAQVSTGFLNIQLAMLITDSPENHCLADGFSYNSSSWNSPLFNTWGSRIVASLLHSSLWWKPHLCRAWTSLRYMSYWWVLSLLSLTFLWRISGHWLWRMCFCISQLLLHFSMLCISLCHHYQNFLISLYILTFSLKQEYSWQHA